jgi:RNA12 protein
VDIIRFDSKEGHKQSALWEVMADWAATLVANRIAHVIVTSDNAQATKSLTKGPSGFSVVSLNSAN